MFKEFFLSMRKPSVKTLAQQKLEHSQRMMLEFQEQLEYYDSMVACMERRIARLKKYVLTEQ